MRRLAALTGVIALVVVTWGSSPAVANARLSGTVTVFAAASLTESFTALGKEFEHRYPRVTVKFDFAGSSELATQIQQGAPADVFASADEANLKKIVDSGDATARPVRFARNRLEIAVEKGNPKKIHSLADLARRGLVVVLCADSVPCGKLANEAFKRAGVRVHPASKEDNVKAVVNKVALGEADAGVVYVTDVKSAHGSVQGVLIAARHNVVANYPIASLAGSSHPAAARAWVSFVRSSAGQKILRRFGFLSP